MNIIDFNSYSKATTHYSTEDNCYIAKINNIDGLSAHGNSPEEAIREIYIALGAMLEIEQEEIDYKQTKLKIQTYWEDS